MFETSSITYFYLLFVFLLCLTNKLKCNEIYTKRFIVGKEIMFWYEFVFFAPKKGGVTIQITELFFRFQLCLVVLTKPAMCFLIHRTLYFDATPYRSTSAARPKTGPLAAHTISTRQVNMLKKLWFQDTHCGRLLWPWLFSKHFINFLTPQPHFPVFRLPVRPANRGKAIGHWPLKVWKNVFKR